MLSPKMIMLDSSEEHIAANKAVDAWLMQALPESIGDHLRSLAQIGSDPFWVDGPDCLVRMSRQQKARIVNRVLARLLRIGLIARKKGMNIVRCARRPRKKRDWVRYSYFKRIWHYSAIKPEQVLNLMAAASCESR